MKAFLVLALFLGLAASLSSAQGYGPHPMFRYVNPPQRPAFRVLSSHAPRYVFVPVEQSAYPYDAASNAEEDSKANNETSPSSNRTTPIKTRHFGGGFGFGGFGGFDEHHGGYAWSSPTETYVEPPYISPVMHVGGGLGDGFHGHHHHHHGHHHHGGWGFGGFGW